MQTKVTIEQIRQQPQVASANEWKGRIYINVRGNGGNFAGERNSKLWILDNKLTFERGKGTCSSAWGDNRVALAEWLAANGVEV